MVLFVFLWLLWSAVKLLPRMACTVLRSRFIQSIVTFLTVVEIIALSLDKMTLFWCFLLFLNKDPDEIDVWIE